MPAGNKRCLNCGDHETGCNECHGVTPPAAPCAEECPPVCCHTYAAGIDPHELWCQKQSAVLLVHTEFHFTTSTTPGLLPIVDLAYDSELFTVRRTRNGWFMEKHIIITTADAVLAAPDHTLAFNRIPFDVNQIDPATLQSHVMTRANRITVDVYDVNGTKKNYNYNATLLGVYGLGDIAALYINRNGMSCIPKPPCIKACHPYFNISCSRRYRAGLPAYCIGNIGTRSLGGEAMVNSHAPLSAAQTNGIACGHIVDPRHTDRAGFALQELIVVGGMDIFDDAAGMPILNMYGNVIGMQTMTKAGAVPAGGATQNALTNTLRYHRPNGDGYVAGPTGEFMIHIITVIVCALRKCYKDFVRVVSDPVGDYVSYQHGFLGAAVEVVSGQEMMSYREAATGAIRTRFDPLTGAYVESGYRNLLGLRVAGLTRDIPGTRVRGDVYLPGASAPGSDATYPWVDSALPLQLNDIILFADVLELGDGKFGGNDLMNGHIPLLLFTSRLRPGDSIKLFALTNASNYDPSVPVEVPVGLKAIPPFFNYPHYKRHTFYPAELAAYATFSFPFCQQPGLAHPVDASRSVPTIPVL